MQTLTDPPDVGDVVLIQHHSPACTSTQTARVVAVRDDGCGAPRVKWVATGVTEPGQYPAGTTTLDAAAEEPGSHIVANITHGAPVLHLPRVRDVRTSGGGL